MRESIVQKMVNVGFTEISARRYVSNTPDNVLEQIVGDFAETIYVAGLLKLIAMKMEEMAEDKNF
jgi:hypothetical protein